MARYAIDADRTAIEGDPVDQTEVEKPLCFTRGLNPRAALAWVRKQGGADATAAVLQKLDPVTRAWLFNDEGRIAANTWVPFLAHAHLLRAIDQTFGSGDLTRLREVGRFMAKQDVPLIARPLIRLASPGFFLDKAMKLWTAYHSHGRWEITRTECEAHAVLVGHPEHDAAFCAAFLGWLEGAVSLAGARSPRSEELRCASKGGQHCRFALRWNDAAAGIDEVTSEKTVRLRLRPRAP